ncbi:hypothetical protein [Bradyrhizobium yuanmingense]|uniref:Integrase n=1 Tax=Bradyrhizobium yuanmingense TaxID=108015 RepID=A0ABV4G7G2_9BRAD|nr:hypothetical protein [Bradyrhizobium yuanmingense]
MGTASSLRAALAVRGDADSQETTPHLRTLAGGTRCLVAAASEVGYPFGAIVQLCMLTGQRRGEVVQLRRSYISGDTVTLPSSLIKNNPAHTFPIGATALDVIKNISGNDDLLFIGTGSKGILSDWSKKKLRLNDGILLSCVLIEEPYLRGRALVGGDMCPK